jgi:carbamate kinase
MTRTAVVALGGNAFTRQGQTGTYSEQSDNARRMARTVLTLRRSGWNVVVVHGNGPQVGNLAIQQDEALGLVPGQPLFSLGAMTQGELGSLISLALHASEPDLRVAALVTHVIVSPDDPAFASPTKPIGPFFTRARADELASQRGWTVAQDSGRGYRRVVASPHPREVLETEAIRSLLADGVLVVACGGGGVPVVAGDAGLHGVDAVIDKDFVACRLATALAAQAIVFITDVPRLALDFGSPDERPLGEIDAATADRHQREGQFPAGSMGPKVHAAIEFLRSGGEVAVISTAELAADTLEPPSGVTERTSTGTRIVATGRRAEAAS